MHVSGFADEISPDLHVQIAGLSELGIKGYDLRSVGGVNVLDLTDAEVIAVNAACAEQGLHVQAVGSPVNKCPLTSENRVAHRAKLVRAIEVARLLGVRRIRIFSPEVQEDQYESAWPLVRLWMAEQVEMAKAADIVLLHENDGRYYGAYPALASRLFEEFGGPNFRAAFDFSNSVLIGFDPVADWMPWIVPHLDTLHIKDAKDGKVVAAGEGDGKIEECLRMLFAQKWDGTLTLEPHLQAAGPYGGFSGKDLFGVAAKALFDMLARLGK